MNVTKFLIASIAGGTVANCMQAVCKNADMELNLIGKIGTYLVGTYCAYSIVNKFTDVINPILGISDEEDEAN